MYAVKWIINYILQTISFTPMFIVFERNEIKRGKYQRERERKKKKGKNPIFSSYTRLSCEWVSDWSGSFRIIQSIC